MQHAFKDLLSHWENPINLATRERRVQKESNLDVLYAGTELLSQHGRHQHQVVVVDPNDVVVLDLLCHLASKDAIRISICHPGILVKRNLAGVVVEEGPQNGIWRKRVSKPQDGKSKRQDILEKPLSAIQTSAKSHNAVHFAGILTVTIRHLVGQPYGHGIVLLLELLLDLWNVLLRKLESRPAEPAKGGRLGHSRETAHQTTRRHGVVVVARVFLFNGDWEPVAHHDQVVFAGAHCEEGSSRRLTEFRGKGVVSKCDGEPGMWRSSRR